MLEILFVLLMLGMMGSTLFVGLRERKTRLAAAKSLAKPVAKPGPDEESPEQLDGFSGDAPEQFEFNAEEFKK